ncbi:hypothetical protein GH714_041672 [Hevea brasiliensis]|uniref:Transposase MuDR plant domain-containing protein n=1 Tax=Hevea brasiliensis TaxID=3981 RepID=A0A6A6MRB4_HEVBR|nr:hypothetical protein GH714_041672 [Hevea brasiliensis]
MLKLVAATLVDLIFHHGGKFNDKGGGVEYEGGDLNIRELHIYVEHAVQEPNLSYEFPPLPSIVSDIDVGPSVENENLRGRENVGTMKWGQRVEETIGFDDFFSTQCSGVNLERAQGHTFMDKGLVGVGASISVDGRKSGKEGGQSGKEDNIMRAKSDGELSVGKEINDEIEDDDSGNSSSDESESNLSEYLSSDNPGSFESNDEDSDEKREEFVIRRSKKPKYNGEAEQLVFSLGMEFSDASEFRAIIAKYSVSQGVKIREM